MMKKYLVAALSLLLVCHVQAQVDPTGTIPQMLGQLKTMSKDTARLHLMLNIAFAYILKPGSEKTDVDSAFLLIGQAKAFNDQHDQDPRIAGLCDLMYANAWKEKGDNKQGKQYAQKAVDEFQQQNDRLDWAYAVFRLAGFYHYDRRDEDSIRISLYIRTIPVFDSLGIIDKQERAREIAGDCMLQYGGKTDQALLVLLQALHLDTSMPKGDPRNLYNLLGITYNKLADQHTAINYLYKAIRLEEIHQPQEIGLVSAYNRLGVIYNSIANYENAIPYFQKSLDAAIRFKDVDDAREVGLNLVKSYYRTGRTQMAIDTLNWLVKQYPASSTSDSIEQDLGFTMIYSQLKDTTLIARVGAELKGILPRTDPDSFERFLTLNGLSDYSLATRQFVLMRMYGNEMLHIGTEMGVAGTAREVSKIFYRADSIQGDWHAATLDYQHFIHLRDSTNDVVHSRQIAGLRVEFEAENKDKDIESLKQTQQLSKAALHQANIARNAIIAGAVLLLILLGLAINRYRIRQRTNRQLNQLLSEKEWLLREIHHRVKNNLQLAMSLLNTQSFYIDNKKTQEAIRQSRNRMYAMSLIHQRLYQLDNLETIDMSEYIPELVSYIRDSVDDQQYIQFHLNVQPLRLDVALAVPLGLIVNEAVTNSIKYAFPGRLSGQITILLEKASDSSLVRFQISDNGIGLPAGFRIDKSASMGMRLIETLVSQIDGDLTINNAEGLSLAITFKMATP
jgi:two-component system, sensor histidine kinase PdtaS